MDIIELSAEKRETVGKESSKKLRRRGMVPAVLYSDGTATPLVVNAREFSTLAHSGAGTHVIVKLKFPDTKRYPNAIIKEVQRNPVRDEYYHIDFQKIALTEKITAMVPLHLIGEAPGVKEGGILERHAEAIELEGLPTEMPDHLEVDISGLDIGHSIHATDIALPEGYALLTDPEAVLLSIVVPRAVVVETPAVEEIAPEGAEGTAEEAAEEGEAAAEAEE